MQESLDPISLKPPRPGRWSLPVVIALVAHLLLIAALTWGVNWQQDAQPVTFEAELWSPTVQRAAPKAVTPPPVPQPKPEPKIEPKPKPEPEPEPEPKQEPKAEPTPPDTREADIAIAKKKKEKEEAEKKAAALKKKKDEELAKKEKEAKEAKLAEAEKQKKAKEEERAQQKALDDKIKQVANEKRQQAAADKAREENMRRIMGQAGATGSSTATGTALRDSGPSAGYGGRVQARVRPNVLLTDDIPGNPEAEVTVHTAPDGTIISRKLTRSSGNAQWDKAALAAIDRTGVLPRDVDGRVPTPMTIALRPRE